MVLTSLGLWLCLTALGEGSEVLGFVWALCSLGKLLDSCWLLSREEKGCGMLKVVFISCSEVLAALWAGATECLSSEWLGSLQRYRDGWRLEKEQQECVM